MPHNLYLHSALVQSRDVTRSRQAVAEACRYNLIDSAIAMNGAFLVNAAILIVAAATFYPASGRPRFKRPTPCSTACWARGSRPFAFALALLCAGQSSTITGTLAGQITMEGFLQFRIRPWLRRLVTRALAIVPAVAVILAAGEKGVYQLLILSQVILSLQLSFAVVPLVRFTGSKQKMGPFVNRWWVQVLAWLVTVVIMVLNGKLVYEQVGDWIVAAGSWGWLVGLALRARLAGTGGAAAVDDLPPRKAGAGSGRGLGRRGRRPGGACCSGASGGSAWPWTPSRATPPCSPRPSPWPRPTTPNWC